MSGLKTQLTGQIEIAKQAQLKGPKMVFTSLNKYLTKDWLVEAYRRTRKDGAAGIDGQSATEFEQELSKNLDDLLELAKSGRYVAPPVKRAYIPKADGSKRPLGIPTLKDKTLQRAVLMLLEPIYEQDFLACSYGFRPNCSAIDASETLQSTLFSWGDCFVIDVDVRKYFDTIDHKHLRTLLDLRVRDGVVRRLIDKWLSAGYHEDGIRKVMETGSPQGGVISPLLSNIYMHHVLDEWFEQVVMKHVQGPIKLIRYADDFVIVTKLKEDAERIYAVLSKRFEKYGLKLHEDKTRMLPFNAQSRASFNFLGFTHYWGKSRSGRLIPMRKTAKDRFKRMCANIKERCRKIRHVKVEIQQEILNRILRGIYGYFGVTHNMRSLQRLHHEACRLWYRSLRLRSQNRHLTWESFTEILMSNPLASPYLPHSIFRGS